MRMAIRVLTDTTEGTDVPPIPPPRALARAAFAPLLAPIGVHSPPLEGFLFP
jgi:hypothetical protein